jgi:ParB family chromosome partitioning protein
VLQVAPAEIGPSPFQTRAAETEEELAGLAASVRASGVLQPLTVRRAGPDAPSGVRWELVCGHRRLAAARLAGLPMVPCVALDMDDDAAQLANVVENLQRKDLSPLEEADGVAALTEGGKTAPEIAEAGAADGDD